MIINIKYNFGRGVKLRYFAKGLNGNINPKNITPIPANKRAGLGLLLKNGDFFVLIIKTTAISVTKDSTNQPV